MALFSSTSFCSTVGAGGSTAVVTVTGTLEVTGLVADKRTRDHAANVVAAFGQLFTGDFAQLVEFIQPKVSSWQAIWNTESAEV